ncbi:acetyltransferase [Myxococcus sp. CA051A]|uniref:esterase/lipase family protein n=1 Tax=unclassified Myxococcus TaxID=2648731 RepID=UPI00157B6A76|nr:MULTISPECIES: acetyltransferase [unclassified Myxococcus]NTX49844.1 acetyltransferase [Myxococcus sp. CA039A]NTX59108.1 acetyltransferase [Myxococcus sp. CA051A]
MKQQPLFLAVLTLGVLGVVSPATAAEKTTYPVVFAHGLGGFDDILGYDYWGDDYGTFVGDPCNELFEVSCNSGLNSGQRAFAAAVQPVQSSDVRGLDLANDVEGFMATAGSSYVNLVGHSQGGIDVRKAARVLRERKGYTVVKALVSVSSPHRGSPVAKYILDLGPGITSVLDALFRFYGDVVYAPGNDGYAAVKALIYNDADANDGKTTGAKAFNIANPINASYASHYASLITAQQGLSVNPALFVVREFLFDIDGDGACADDCDNDGAGGKGDGNRSEQDDDGLVGVNSQQMGYRLRYTERLGSDLIAQDSALGYVSNINAPSALQSTSMSSVINQDHLDVIGLGPDTFSEMEFYAAIIDYIAKVD